MSANRAVITGLGVLAANGNCVESFWRSLCENRTGIGPIRQYQPNDEKSRVAGEVKGFDARLREEGEKETGRAIRFAVACASMAVQDAGLSDRELHRPGGLPIVFGRATSEFTSLTQDPSFDATLQSIPGFAAAEIGRQLRVPTRVWTLSDACASGLAAVSVGADLIRSGQASLVMVGGAEATVTRWLIRSLFRLGCLAATSEEDWTSCRPFDRSHHKSVLGEGGGVVILEEERHARARGAAVYAAIAGHGTWVDEVGQPPAGGLERSMQMAIQNAGRRPENVDHVNAHASGDREMDRIEVGAIKNVFQAHAFRIPITSIKGATGSPLGTAGIHQLIAAALTLKRGQIPPTTNLETLDPACDVDVVMRSPRMNSIRSALVNTHGASGSNVSVLLDAWE